MIPVFGKHYTFRLSIDESEDTVLDVIIGTNENDSEITKAKKTVQRLLNDFTPSFKKPESATAAPEFESEDQTPVEPTVPPEPETPSTPPEKKPAGAKGLLKLRCPECGNRFGVFLRERQSEIVCKCGHHIDLTVPLARYRFICPYCEAERWGLTNLEDPTISVKCKCGGMVDMQWVPKAKEYQN